MADDLDLLWLRVPPIRYVSPPACVFEASGSGSSGPTIVIDVHPRLKITGLRIENCMLVWDSLPVECEGSCPTVFCYNVYRSDTETGSFELFAECVNETQFLINDDACYRVSAITSEGESDLSDAVCAECAPPLPPPTLSISDCVLSWNSIPGAVSYNIYRNGVLLSQGYLGTSLPIFDDACYQVTANSARGQETAFSNEICAECAQECDEEVVDWVSRVIGFGSSVSQTTFEAACELMAGLKAAGLREKIVRMNIYAGDTKEACNAPFIRDLGASFEQFRNIIGFGTWIYSETGAGGGLRSLGNDILDTEIPANDPNLPLEDYHIGFYKTVSDGFGSRIQMGAGTSTGSPVVLAATFNPLTDTNYFMHSPTGDILGVPDTDQLGHFVLARSGTLTVYKNGVSIGSNPTPGGSRSAGNIYVHNASLDGNPWPATAANGVFACYHIGTFLTAGETATLYGLIQAFQTALTRNV